MAMPVAVWTTSEENNFRFDVVDLFRVAGHVPRGPQLMPFPDSLERPVGEDVPGESSLPFDTEECLATAFALVAAISDLTTMISACCVEQQRDNGNIILRIASNQGVATDAQEAVKSVVAMLKLETINSRYIQRLRRTAIQAAEWPR